MNYEKPHIAPYGKFPAGVWKGQSARLVFLRFGIKITNKDRRNFRNDGPNFSNDDPNFRP
jgi:hypothetical protein